MKLFVCFSRGQLVGKPLMGTARRRSDRSVEGVHEGFVLGLREGAGLSDSESAMSTYTFAQTLLLHLLFIVFSYIDVFDLLFFLFLCVCVFKICVVNHLCYFRGGAGSPAPA